MVKLKLRRDCVAEIATGWSGGDPLKFPVEAVSRLHKQLSERPERPMFRLHNDGEESGVIATLDLTRSLERTLDAMQEKLTGLKTDIDEHFRLELVPEDGPHRPYAA
ncbi:MAG: hypothetical protein H7Y88_13725 [Phycisphaerales bacterium]|nr:hypothetical protein [Phycisphaerales bacterium]